MSKRQTTIKYQDTALPTAGVAVTLFNSATAFPPGGCLHFLGQNWFQYTLAYATAAGAEAGTVTGAFSLDNGATWTQFYSKAVNSGADPTVAINEDEVFIAQYVDVRFQFTQSTHADTIFRANLALNPDKSSATRDATSATTGALV